MIVRACLLVVTLLVPCAALGCGPDDAVGTPSCVMAATIAFDGREYIAVESLPGPEPGRVRVGRLLGTGERATCPGRAVQEVQVHRLIGVPVGEAVFSTPDFGLMARWNEDGAIR